MLLPKGRNALWDQLLPQRRGLHRREPGAVRLSGRNDTVRERREHDVLSSGPGVWFGVPLGVGLRHSVGVCERDDIYHDHLDINDYIDLDDDDHTLHTARRAMLVRKSGRLLHPQRSPVL